jgi:hypothetical protein
MWGSRRFPTGDTSKNTFWVALLTFGEGWHNNHHAYPQSSRHGLAWYELDLNWYAIIVLRAVGLAWEVKARSLNMNKNKEKQLCWRLPLRFDKELFLDLPFLAEPKKTGHHSSTMSLPSEILVPHLSPCAVCSCLYIFTWRSQA